MGTQLVEQIFNNNQSSFDFDSDTERLVENLIIGNTSGVSSDDRWIFEIVNNKRNSLDVDKFDYLQRDMEHTGKDFHLDTSLLVDRCKVLNGQIAYPIDLHDQVSKVFSVRHTMFQQVYYHPRVQAMELMLLDVFLESQCVMKYEDYIQDTKKYITLVDQTIFDIQKTKCKELEAARNILERIEQRHSGDVYKLTNELILNVDEKVAKEIFTPERLAGYGPVNPAEIRTAVRRINCAPSGNKNPLRNVQYFDESTYEPVEVEDSEGFDKVESSNNEVIVRVFSTSRENFDAVKEATEKCVQERVSEDWILPSPTYS